MIGQFVSGQDRHIAPICCSLRLDVQPPARCKDALIPVVLTKECGYV